MTEWWTQVGNWCGKSHSSKKNVAERESQVWYSKKTGMKCFNEKPNELKRNCSWSQRLLWCTAVIPVIIPWQLHAKWEATTCSRVSHNDDKNTATSFRIGAQKGERRRRREEKAWKNGAGKNKKMNLVNLQNRTWSMRKVMIFFLFQWSTTTHDSWVFKLIIGWFPRGSRHSARWSHLLMQVICGSTRIVTSTVATLLAGIWQQLLWNSLQQNFSLYFSQNNYKTRVVCQPASPSGKHMRYTEVHW